MKKVRDIEIRTTVASDLDIVGMEAPVSFSGDTFWRNGEIVAIAGISKGIGRPIAFMELFVDDLPKMTIWRIAKEYVKMYSGDVYAGCHLNVTSAHKFVEKLGFSFVKEQDGVRLYKWQK